MLRDQGTDDERGERARLRVELRYRAVLEVRSGHPVGEIAARYGVSRQSVTIWRKRYERLGLDGLKEFSRRPHHSPARLPAEVEALVCELRRTHRRWGARRISHELTRRGTHPAPSHATVHRVLVRNGLVRGQEQRRERTYKRWQREAPMHLWQLDIMGGVFLADGRECKLLTSIDDHSRFVVAATVLERPTGNAVCAAFTGAMHRHGVPFEVLTDNGKQFTGRFTRPIPAEVLFERTCREYGITQRLTKRRSPTTTGKIERWHKTLRRELLDEAGAFADLATAQAAIDVWVRSYNYDRPHQSLAMATPASLFRPHTPLSDTSTSVRVAPATARNTTAAPAREPVAAHLSPPSVVVPDDQQPTAVQIDLVVPPSGSVGLAGHQQLWLGKHYRGRTITVWADQRNIHVLLDGHHVKTVASRLSETHLQHLLMRGAHPAGPPPAAPALPQGPLPPATVIELDRTVNRHGTTTVGGHSLHLGPHLAGSRVTLRLDGHLAHIIHNDQLVKTLPAPVDHDQRAQLRGARLTSQPLPPRPPAGAIQVQRRVPKDGVTMVARQRLRIGRTYAGKTVTILVEDTHFRVLDGTTELAIHPRDTNQPIRHFKAHAPRLSH